MPWAPALSEGGVKLSRASATAIDTMCLIHFTTLVPGCTPFNLSQPPQQPTATSSELACFIPLPPSSYVSQLLLCTAAYYPASHSLLHRVCCLHLVNGQGCSTGMGPWQMTTGDAQWCSCYHTSIRSSIHISKVSFFQTQSFPFTSACRKLCTCIQRIPLSPPQHPHYPTLPSSNRGKLGGLLMDAGGSVAACLQTHVCPSKASACHHPAATCPDTWHAAAAAAV